MLSTLGTILAIGNTTTLLGVIHLILFIVALVSIITNPGFSIGAKVLWALVVLLLPVIGLIIYYLVA